MKTEKPAIELLQFLRRAFEKHIDKYGEENCHEYDLELDGRYVPALRYSVKEAIKHYGDQK